MVRIIKAAAPCPSPTARTAAGFIDLSHEVQAQLDQARDEAAGILDIARREGDEIRRQAECVGRRQAEEAAQQRVRDEVARQLATAVPALYEAAQALRAARAGHLAQCETGVVRLAAAIAARLVRRELTADPQLPLALIREALDLAAGCQQIRLRLAPEDYKTLLPAVSQLTGAQGDGVTAEVIADASVTPGGCIAQTEFGTIDQRFESQLARIVEELI